MLVWHLLQRCTLNIKSLESSETLQLALFHYKEHSQKNIHLSWGKKTTTSTSWIKPLEIDMSRLKCLEAHCGFHRTKRSHIRQTFTGLVKKSECRGWEGMSCDARTPDENKGWCITEAEMPDSTALGEQANCEDTVKRFPKVSVRSGANGRFSVYYNAIQLNGDGKDMFKAISLHKLEYWLRDKSSLKMCHFKVSSINHLALGHPSDPDGYSGGLVALPAHWSQRLCRKCFPWWEQQIRLRFVLTLSFGFIT